jgi:hypothetical protein
MAADKKDECEEVVCEFFGIEITTKNPKVARVLTTDVAKIMNLEITVRQRTPKDPELPGDPSESTD